MLVDANVRCTPDYPEVVDCLTNYTSNVFANVDPKDSELYNFIMQGLAHSPRSCPIAHLRGCHVPVTVQYVVNPARASRSRCSIYKGKGEGEARNKLNHYH